MQGSQDAFAGVFLSESLVDVAFGGILTPAMSAGQSQSGTRPGSPSRLVLEGVCDDRSAGADGGSSLTTTFNGLDLSSLLHSGHSSSGGSNILLHSGRRTTTMDFNDLGMFGKREGHGQDGSSSGSQHQQQQRQHHHSQPQPGQNSVGTSNPNAVNLEALQQLLSMQMSMPYPQQTQQGSMDANNAQLQTQNQLQAAMQNLGSGANGNGSSAGESSPAAALIFEQQLRVQQLQQLQQLQNQIFQQQLELLNGQNSGLDGTTSPLSLQNTGQFHGLPTPINSTELRPQTHVSFATPATYIQPQAQPYPQFSTPGVSNAHNSSNAGHGQVHLPLGSSSAPAHLAFASHNPLGMGDMELELSPITSPWLSPVQYQQQSEQQQQHQQTQMPPQQQQPQTPMEALGMGGSTTRSSGRQTAAAKKRMKRGASDSGEDGTSGVVTTSHAKKRQSAGRQGSSGTNILGEGNTNSSGRRVANARGSASVGSTPAFLGRGRRNSEAIADTPSPVDLSMPPPSSITSVAANAEGPNFQSLSPPENSVSGTSPALSPVTPASIMNLGRLGLGSGLSPPLNTSDQQDSLADASSKSNSASTSNSKGKSKASNSSRPTNRRASTSNLHQHQQEQPKSQAQTSASGLKPLLPGGVSPASAPALASSPNYTHHLSGASSSLNLVPSTPLPPPLPAVRKSSHKAAEQKRRDSLKTSFDALRSLLPPLILPNDEHYNGEAPLPGALPPRGPPKGGEGGANRMVSKLQLLRAGNEYIGVLKGRVERREGYIRELKEEVGALRMLVRQQQQQQSLGLPLRQGEEGGESEAREGDAVGEAQEREEEGEDDPVERALASLNVKMVDLDLDLDVCEENMGSAGQMRLRDETIAEGDEADDEDV